MSSGWTWASKRQAIIIGSFLTIVFLIGSFVLIAVFKSDRVDESEIWVGPREPLVFWSVVFPVSGDLHGAVGHFINVELDHRSPKANYRLTFFDSEGEVMGRRTGETFFDAGESFYIFERDLYFSETPEWTTLTWENINWEEGSRGDVKEGYDFSISNIRLTRELSTPRLEARLVNTGSLDIPSVETVALIMDEYDNVVSASRVLLRSIPFNGDARLSLSWPERFRFLESICSPSLETRVVLLDHTGEDASSVTNVMSRFESDIDEGFLWSFEFFNTEEMDSNKILEEAVKEARSIRYRDAPLFVFLYSETTEKSLVSEIEDALGSYEFVESLLLNRDNRGYLPSRLSDLYDIFDARCVQEPDNIRIHGRIVD